MNIEVKPIAWKELDSLGQVFFFCLPDDFIVNSHLMSLVSAADIYRRSLDDLDPMYVAGDPIICQLQKCLNHTDVNLLMAECWADHYNPESNSTKFNEQGGRAPKLDAYRRQMKNLIGQIYESVFSRKSFEIDPIYPTRPSQLSCWGF